MAQPCQIRIQQFLQESLADAQRRNPKYSLRSFARRLGMSPALLSLILSGKRQASKRVLDEVFSKLGMDAAEYQKLAEIYQNFETVKNPYEVMARAERELTSDQFRAVSEWHHFAILALAETKDFDPSPSSIAARLGITQRQVEHAIERLVRLKMLKLDAKENLRLTGERFHTADEVSDVAVRKSQHEDLDLAHQSLDHDPLDRRDITSLTMAVDVTKMKQAKTLIRKFRKDMELLLNTPRRKQEVYKLCVQLFPISKTIGEIKK